MNLVVTARTGISAREKQQLCRDLHRASLSGVLTGYSPCQAGENCNTKKTPTLLCWTMRAKITSLVSKRQTGNWPLGSMHSLTAVCKPNVKQRPFDRNDMQNFYFTAC
ncbi:hypothetical protein XENOCAPTIV_011006 [Xenoophorus captivus]|uniref:Uncharacterized protein n=1 Tax=Xenoophorus captivus TaxID=1517983 RepID=A0ABV0QR41_9TELE